MWTEIARERYRREDLRCASDMTDAKWALIEPHPPGQKALGRPRIFGFGGLSTPCSTFCGRRGWSNRLESVMAATPAQACPVEERGQG
jgi:hypothetical protein